MSCAVCCEKTRVSDEDSKIIRLYVMSVMVHKSVLSGTSRDQEEGLSGNWLPEWVRQSHSDPTNLPPHPPAPPNPKPTPIPHTVTQHFWTFPVLLGSEADWGGVALFHVAAGCDVFKDIKGRGCGCSTVSLIESDG